MANVKKATSSIKDLCAGIDLMPNEFMGRDLIDQAGVKAPPGIMIAMADRGLLEIMPGFEHKRQKRYRKLKENYAEIYDQGGLSGIWSSRRNEDGDGTSSPATRDDSMLVDPQEVLSALSPEQFAEQLTLFIESQVRITEPLREEIKQLQNELRILQSAKSSSEANLDATIRGLRDELRLQGERLINVNAELSREREKRMVKPEREVRVVAQRVYATQPGKESGAHGSAPQGVRVHARPHAPSSVSRLVVEHKKR